MRYVLAIAGLSLFGQAAVAIQPLPKAAGWNGFVSPTLSAMSFRDNQVSGAGSLDVGTKRLDSLDDKPDRDSIAAFSFSGEVGYMFADQGLYLFLGNRLEDFLRLDNSSAVGARWDAGRVGIAEASALFSAVPTEVWTDPYLTGADREETDRTSGGGRLGLSRILGTPWEAQLTMRSVHVDNERSGESLNLDAAGRDLLVRDGNSAGLEILYTWVLNERHILVPSFEVGTYDAEGAAISRNGAGVQLTHAYGIGRYRLVSNLALRQTFFDEKNPVFDQKQDETEVVASVTGFYGQLWGIKKLSGMATLLYAKRDSDINFFTAEASVISLGLLYAF